MSARIILLPFCSPVEVKNPQRWGSRSKNVVSIRIAKNKKINAKLSYQWVLKREYCALVKHAEILEVALQEAEDAGERELAKHIQIELEKVIQAMMQNVSRNGDFQ